MKTREYQDLASKLHFPSDIGKLARDRNINRELLLIIYTQTVVRDATKRYYRIKNKSDQLLWQWKKGTTLAQIARKERFPPVLLALILMREYGLTRKEFWRYVRDPACSKEKRLQREIYDVVREDIIYSPAGMEVQYQRGKKGEARLQEWLEDNGIGYRTEDEIKSEYEKTPDALLDEPLKIDGHDIFWIESKANFGDNVEIRRNNKKQLIPYTQLFGPGIVVYWFGFVSDHKPVEGVRVVDANFFQRKL